MKIERAGTFTLYEGDSVTVSVTHEIKINGDKSWVGLQATSKVLPDEDSTAARVYGYVNAQVMDAVKNTVETVNSVG